MTVIINKVEKNIGKVIFLGLYALVAFWFLVNGEGVFTSWGTSWTFNAIIYLLGVSLFVSTLEDEFPVELRTSLPRTITYFSLFSIGSLIVLLVIQDFGLLFTGSAVMPYHLVLANMTFQLVIVASSEEIIFRGVVFGYLYDRFKLRSDKQLGWVIPYLLSAFIFAFFHFAVYGLNLSNMIIVFLMGLVFAYLVERWGLGASIGVHWIWNCMAIGVFSLPSSF